MDKNKISERAIATEMLLTQLSDGENSGRENGWHTIIAIENALGLSEEILVVSDEELTPISDRLLEKNQEAYTELVNRTIFGVETT